MFSNHHKLVVLGVIVHVILLYSIFDIYYTSPLVRGTQPHPITKGDGPAKRLVIISAGVLYSSINFKKSCIFSNRISVSLLVSDYRLFW